MTQLRPTPDRPVQIALLRTRWIVWLLAVAASWIDTSRGAVPDGIWLWLVIVAAYDVSLTVAPRLVRSTSPRWSAITLACDAALFGLVPYLATLPSSVVAHFALFPALVAAVLYGPEWALLIGLALAAPIEWRAAADSVLARDTGPLTDGFPAAALVVFATLTGWLARREREHLAQGTSQQLAELREAMAGAKLLYQTSAAVSATTSYVPILDAMLAAGTRAYGGGRNKGLPVGIALLFEGGAREHDLHVVAARNLDRRDLEQRILGQAGIVARALQTGNPVEFDTVSDDPELHVFSALAHCQSGVCYALQAGLEQYGVVLVAGPGDNVPSEQHVELMTAFTNQAAIAFQNAKLYQDLRAENDQTIRSENEMRQKLARDLHDGPTQKVAALVMQLDYINRLVDRDVAEAKLELERARNTAQQTVKEIRTALFTLRPLVLESKGLSAALEQYCTRLLESEGVAIQVDAGRVGPDLDPHIAATVFAIVDEAVNNARKHAQGKPIFVQAGIQGSALVALVRDQGPGFDVEKTISGYDERSSLGMQNMRERARLIDGELRIDSARGRGTCITLIVPLPRTNAVEARP